MNDDEIKGFAPPDVDQDEIAHMGSLELDFFNEITNLEDFNALDAEISRRREGLPDFALLRLDALRGDHDAIERLLNMFDRPIDEALTNQHRPF